MTCGPCNGCALTEGAHANLEVKNHLAALICVRAGVPFYCHAGSDWKTPGALVARIFRRERVPTCAGWRRETRRLAGRGYFRRARVLKRRLGELALSAMDRFVGEKDSATKATAKAQLSQCLGVLFQEKRLEKMAKELTDEDQRAIAPYLGDGQVTL